MVSLSTRANAGDQMIYADANGSLPPLPEVREHVRKRLDSNLWANPNAIHSLGGKIKDGLERCRSIVANALGCDPAHIIWNSGSSEGISTVFNSILTTTDKKIIYLSGIEHAAVINTALSYGDCEVRFIPVMQDGVIDFEWLVNDLKTSVSNTALITCMAANNETGVLQPWEKIRDLAKQNNVLFFCDTTQLIGRLSFNFLESGLDYAIVTGHKLGALPGSGCLLARDPGALKPLVYGGGQEQGLRGGTQNYLSTETLAIACLGLADKVAHVSTMNEMRLIFENEIKRRFPSVVVIGESSIRLPGTTLLGYPGLHGQAVQIELESQDIFVTTSAACSDNEPSTSKVLKSMKVDDTLGRSVVRISLPLSSTQLDYNGLLGALTNAYEKLAKIKAY